MSNAHEGDADGLRIGGWVPETDSESSDEETVSEPSDAEPVIETSDAESSDAESSDGAAVTGSPDESPVKVVTQSLPTVPDGRVGSSVPPVMDGDGSIQRAVARRAPAPLPNLGRDESPGVDAPSRKRSGPVPVPTAPVDGAAEPLIPEPDDKPDSTPEPAKSTGRLRNPSRTPVSASRRPTSPGRRMRQPSPRRPRPGPRIPWWTATRWPPRRPPSPDRPAGR